MIMMMMMIMIIIIIIIINNDVRLFSSRRVAGSGPRWKIQKEKDGRLASVFGQLLVGSGHQVGHVRAFFRDPPTLSGNENQPQ